MRQTMKRHDTDALSLLFGALFSVVGLVLLSGDPSRGSVSLAWAGPVAAIAVGLLVILAMARSRDRAQGDY